MTLGTTYFAWYNGSGWTISAVVGTNGASYWTTANGSTVEGPYTAQGAASGTPIVAAKGNAVQQTLLSAAQVAYVDAAITSRMATYTQPTGFLAATFPSDPADQSLIISATDAIVTAIGSLATSIGTVSTNLSTLAAKFTGITFLAKWLGLGYGKGVDAPTLAEVNATLGGATFTNVTDSQEAIRDNQSSSSGSGANTVTITVQTTGSVAIQGATVTAWSGVSIVGTGTTNASGVAVLSLNDATYTLNVSASGFNGSSASLVVSGTTAHTYQLTALTITPSTPPEVTGWLVTRVDGVATAGISVTIAMSRTPTGDTGSLFVGDPTTVESDEDGLCEFTGLIPDATYRIRRGGTTWEGTFVADDVTFEIKSFVG